MVSVWHALTCPVCNPLARRRRRRALARIDAHGHAEWARRLNHPTTPTERNTT